MNAALLPRAGAKQLSVDHIELWLDVIAMHQFTAKISIYIDHCELER